MGNIEWSDDHLEDHEYPEPDEDDDETLETVRCSVCGASVWEEAPQCPHCGNYVTADTHALSGRPWWFVILGLIGLVAVIAVLGFVF